MIFHQTRLAKQIVSSQPASLTTTFLTSELAQERTTLVSGFLSSIF
jgi:hypothetical protein